MLTWGQRSNTHYLAAAFATGGEAKAAWVRVNTYQKTHGPGIGCYNLVDRHSGAHLVVIISETPVKDRDREGLVAALAGGRSVEISDDTLLSLMRRRAENLIMRARPDASGAPYYENHAPVALTYGGDGQAGPSSISAGRMAAKILTEELRRRRVPLCDIHWRAALAEATLAAPSAVDILFTTYNETDRYIWTDSARAMSDAVRDPDDSRLPPFAALSVWIEHDRALRPPPDAPVLFKCLSLWHAPRSVRGDEDIAVCVWMDETLETVFNAAYDPRKGAWGYGGEYPCPWGVCGDIDGVDIDIDGILTGFRRAPCAQCRILGDYLTTWVAAALHMIARRYAVSPDPSPFDRTTVAFTDLVEVPRANSKKKRRVPQTVRNDYTVISYEVSETTPRPTAADDEAPSTTGRVSWLRLHGRDSIIYERREIADYLRRLPRRRDGSRKSEDLISVTGTPRYVPRLRPSDRVHRVAKRVRARRFESGS